MRLSFSLSPWLLLPLIAAGAWLAYRLYSGPMEFPPRRWRRVLGGVTLLAWLALAGLLVQPLWRAERSVYREPAVALAVDESPSYARGETLRGAGEVRKSLEEARRFYGGKGFRILEFRFAEIARPADADGDLGIGTNVASLRRLLDSLAPPNLRGVFIWTDGRFHAGAEPGAGAWPAPVFPVSLPAGDWGEVQGEKAEAEFSGADSGARVFVEWRALGKAASRAELEIRSGGKTLWKETMAAPDSAAGKRLRHRLRLSGSALRGAGDVWTAVVRPEPRGLNATGKNDTLEVRVAGLRRRREVFARPLSSLEERGLVDALFASDSMEALAVAPESLEAAASRGGVLWAPSRSPARALQAARKTGAATVLYAFPSASPGGLPAFSPAARVTWSEAAGRFLPGSVLRLADLGAVSDWALPPPDSSRESLAWAEEHGRRGILLSRRKAADSAFEMVVPPLWSARFRPGADGRVLRQQERWVQGAAELARRAGGTATALRDSAPARDPLDAELSRLGIDEESLASLALAGGGSVLGAGPDFPASLPDLPRAQTREERSTSLPLFPTAAATLSVIAALCAVWALRKKFHLD